MKKMTRSFLLLLLLASATIYSCKKNAVAEGSTKIRLVITSDLSSDAPVWFQSLDTTFTADYSSYGMQYPQIIYVVNEQNLPYYEHGVVTKHISLMGLMIPLNYASKFGNLTFECFGVDVTNEGTFFSASRSLYDTLKTHLDANGIEDINFSFDNNHNFLSAYGAGDYQNIHDNFVSDSNSYTWNAKIQFSNRKRGVATNNTITNIYDGTAEATLILDKKASKNTFSTPSSTVTATVKVYFTNLAIPE